MSPKAAPKRTVAQIQEADRQDHIRENAINRVTRALSTCVELTLHGFECTPDSEEDAAKAQAACKALLAYSRWAAPDLDTTDFPGGMNATETLLGDGRSRLAVFHGLAALMNAIDIEPILKLWKDDAWTFSWYQEALLCAAYDAIDFTRELTVAHLREKDERRPPERVA
ncbi:MAG TPA: hypothetical protein VMM79_14320 [Longimicrobiales bacterium]|nr:hypothetical protein [Longimicrobiales bacterium]